MFNLSPAVKNLLIINVLLFAATTVFQQNLGIDLVQYLGLHYFQSSHFGIWQFFTYAFMHANVTHLLSNMLIVFFMASLVESRLGTQRFWAFYACTALGAALVQEGIMWWQLHPLAADVDAVMASPSVANIENFLSAHPAPSQSAFLALNDFISKFNAMESGDEQASLARAFFVQYELMCVDSHVMIGASGGCFGIIMALGILFAEHRFFLLFPPIPIKGKWLALGYGVIELFYGVHGFQYDNVAHWAHLGGMLFGFILLRHWRS